MGKINSVYDLLHVLDEDANVKIALYYGPLIYKGAVKNVPYPITKLRLYSEEEKGIQAVYPVDSNTIGIRVMLDD